jgi:hypothetical protein
MGLDLDKEGGEDDKEALSAKRKSGINMANLIKPGG